MRKQYHFRKVGEDIYIWDVDQLIFQSSHFRVIQVCLDEIKELDEPYWFLNHLPNTLELIEHFKLIKEADLNYPIILCPEGRVMDGMNRLAKAQMQNLSHISAV